MSSRTPTQKQTQSRNDPSLPPLRLVVRDRSGATFVTGSAQDLKDTTDLDTNPIVPAHDDDVKGGNCCVYSKDGSKVAIISKEDCKIYAGDGEEELFALGQTTDRVDFSPLGNFLIVYDRKISRRDSPDGKNLRVYALDGAQGAEPVLAFNQSQFDDRIYWPPIQWTDDENLMIRRGTSQVHFYDGTSPDQILARVNFENVLDAKLAPGTGATNLACFRPATATQPGNVSVYNYPEVKTPTAVKSMFKCDTALLKWDPTGKQILIQTSTESSGDSYYGESNLYLLNADGQFQCNVPFGTKDGPVQCSTWNPKGGDFIAIQGKQPAKIVLYNARNCEPVREFGESSRNHAFYSPHGRFICIAGFGNLAGEMEFWDKNKFKRIGMCQDRDGAKSYQWTPCGRYFITAALAPWRNVDNGFKVWSYAGEKVFEKKYDRLFQVAIQPQPKDVYPDRPMSPRLKGRDLTKVQTAAKVGRYIPPSLRAKGGSNIMNRSVAQPRKLSSLQKTIARGGNTSQRTIPGMPVGSSSNEKPLTKNQIKNRKRKAKKERERKEAEARAKAEEEKKAAEAAAKAAAPPDPAKLAKKYRKQLKQIRQLKVKHANGEELNPDQIKKMGTEEQVFAKLQEVEAQL